MAALADNMGRQATAAPFAIELKGISKAFGPVQANKDINIAVPKGTIHGIIGENGAGKSTLMSILYGFYKADSGQILVSGKLTPIPDSQSAIRAGIGMVPPLLPKINVMKNPLKFIQEVKQETFRVTWPTKKDTMMGGVMVFALASIAAIFFLILDQILRFLLNLVLTINF